MQDEQLVLVEQALLSFEQQEPLDALLLLERAIRLWPARAEHYLLHGVILNELGQADLARESLTNAFYLSPTNDVIRREVLRRVLPFLPAVEQDSLARAVLGTNFDGALLDLAVRFLEPPNADCVGVVLRDAANLVIRIWSRAPAIINVHARNDQSEAGSSVQIHLKPTLDAGFGSYGDARLPWPPGASHLNCSTVEGEVLWLRAEVAHATPPPTHDSPSPFDDEAEVTIIMPVHGGARTTARAIVSVLSDHKSTTRWRLLLVDDASPDSAMPPVLSLAARDRRTHVISLSANVGFVAAVNRGLALTRQSDVILLNADTITAPGWVDRLRAASRHDRRIGTVTPLSNNGEITSFPKPFAENKLGDHKYITSIDRFASNVNESAVVSIPSGIGFCLYIKRECIDAVGFLDADYFESGYLEEVDFCLRAQLKGFVNVCAPSVYVGHVGNVSFGRRKQLLVSKNGAEINRRYPLHEAQCRFFMIADPLEAARNRLQIAWLADADDTQALSLIIGFGFDPEAPSIEALVARLPRHCDRRLIVLAHDEGGDRDCQLVIHDPDGGIPFKLPTNIAKPFTLAKLALTMKRFRVEHLVLIDQGCAMDNVLREIDEHPVSHDLVICDGSLVCPRGDLLKMGHEPCSGQVAVSVCEACLRGARPLHVPRDLNVADYRSLRGRLLATADRVLVQASGFEAMPQSDTIIEVVPGLDMEDVDAGPVAPTASSKPSLAVIPAHSTVGEFNHLLKIIEAARAQHFDWNIIVLGVTLDDAALMKQAHVTVIGSVRAKEISRLIQIFECRALFIHQIACNFFDPLIETALQLPLPKLALNTSAMRALRRSCKGHLPLLNCEADPTTLARQIDQSLSFHAPNSRFAASPPHA